MKKVWQAACPPAGTRDVVARGRGRPAKVHKHGSGVRHSRCLHMRPVAEVLVMMKRLGRLGCACMLLAATLWPADAAAQYRPVYPAHSHSTFVVSAGFGFGYPFYYPFYSPFYAPFYGSYWYPYYGAPFPGYYGP